MATTDKRISAQIHFFGNTQPEDIWKGHYAPDARGARIAINYLLDLENSRPLDEYCGWADLAELNDCARLGRPYRNLLAERLAIARRYGRECERGFLCVIGDYLSKSQGGTPSIAWYIRLLGLEAQYGTPAARDST